MTGFASVLVAAARPRTLPVAVVPVLVGTAVAHSIGRAELRVAIVALASALAIQIGTNYANDVFDAEKGADGPDRVGPTRAVAAGLVSAAAMRRAMWASFAIATLLGLELVRTAGWSVVAIGVASIAAGIAYTGGPAPLAYRGLGDVAVLVFFGFVAVVGTVFVETRTLVPLAFLAAVPVGCLATAILVVNNVRDRATDARAGKRTLVVRFGRRAAEREHLALILAAFVGSATTALWLRSPLPLLPLVTVPLAVRAVRDVARRDGAELNETLAGAARLSLAFGASYAVGIALA